MTKTKKTKINTIFVDCFSTVIFRSVKKNQVFKQWAIELEQLINVPWKIIYKTYKNTNFNLCFKKLFTTFTLQENFEVVLKKMFCKLQKKYSHVKETNFVEVATKVYINKELETFKVNNTLINFLKDEKLNGKKIYLVSDFYCDSKIFTQWFDSLNIRNIFDKIFSSSDFNKEKATTKLYKHLIKQLKLDPKNIIMYGDNIWSDVLMAKLCKIDAKKINNKVGKINETK